MKEISALMRDLAATRAAVPTPNISNSAPAPDQRALITFEMHSVSLADRMDTLLRILTIYGPNRQTIVLCSSQF